jgi:hypothetical protein
MAGFEKAAATAKETRILAWSHIYLGRMMDLDCKRDEAMNQYKAALAVRDGQQDTRLAAERGVKAAYSVKGHTCDVDGEADDPDSKPDVAPSRPQIAAPKAPQTGPGPESSPK